MSTENQEATWMGPTLFTVVLIATTITFWWFLGE